MAEEEQKEKKTNTDERQVVIFKIGKEEFGVNISEVREIIRVEQITKTPNTPEYIRGVINLRGGIIVVIDLARKLTLPVKEADKDTRIIVIEQDNTTVGMLVDSATEVLRLSADHIEPAPTIITKKIDADYIDGVGILGDDEKEQRLIILLDLAKVMAAKDVEKAQKAHKESAVNSPVVEKKEVAKEEKKEAKKEHASKKEHAGKKEETTEEKETPKEEATKTTGEEEEQKEETSEKKD